MGRPKLPKGTRVQDIDKGTGGRIGKMRAPSINKLTHEVQGPLLDAVEDGMLWGKKTYELKAELAPRYGVHPLMIDMAIREVKDYWAKELARTRQERLSKNRQRLEKIVEKAFKSGELKTAKDAIMDQAKLTGDMAPDVHVMLGGDKDPEALLLQAEELKNLVNQKEDE